MGVAARGTLTLCLWSFVARWRYHSRRPSAWQSSHHCRLYWGPSWKPSWATRRGPPLPPREWRRRWAWRSFLPLRASSCELGSWKSISHSHTGMRFFVSLSQEDFFKSYSFSTVSPTHFSSCSRTIVGVAFNDIHELCLWLCTRLASVSKILVRNRWIIWLQ